MYSGSLQPFILHITCLWFTATLVKLVRVGNVFTYLNLYGQNVYMTVTLPHLLLPLLYISYTFTNMTKPFISITFVVLHWSNVFFFFHMSFLESKYNIFRFFFVFCFQEQELSCLSRVCLWISLFAYLISSSILIGSFK